jgi:5'(3')-deoxyribonucleotidase
LLGSKLRAKIHLNDFLDEENDSGDKYLFIEQILPLGTVARGKITEILKEPKLFINGGINGGSNQKITEIIKEPKLFINVGSNQKFLSEQEKTRNLDCLSDA